MNPSPSREGWDTKYKKTRRDIRARDFTPYKRSVLLHNTLARVTDIIFFARYSVFLINSIKSR